jgi:GNAT superfamily N-acetyltransferase
MESNFVNSLRDVKHDNNASFWEDNESTGFITGYACSYLNYVFRFNSSKADIKDQLSLIIKRFKDRGCPAYWFVGVHTNDPKKVGKALLEVGLEPANRGYVGMLLDKSKFQLSPTIEKVTTTQALKDFIHVFKRGFSISEQPAKFFEGYFKANFQNPEQQSLFIGYVNGKPASISAYYIDSGVNMVHSISTLPEYRGRGYGRILTETSILEALKLRDLPVTLYSSEMAERLYQNLGFNHLYVMDKYVIS